MINKGTPYIKGRLFPRLANSTEVVENVPCGSLKSTKFTTVKENSEESNNISKETPKKFIPKFKK